MAGTNTKAILAKIKIENDVKDLIAKSDGENVTVTYNGVSKTLSTALAEILTSVNSTITTDNAKALIAEEIAKVVDGAPEAGDTLKELFELISTNQEAAQLLQTAVSGKVDKVDGKGLSANDFTDVLKSKLDNLPEISTSDIARWNGICGVRIGESMPQDMQNGEIFVQIVNE